MHTFPAQIPCLCACCGEPIDRCVADREWEPFRPRSTCDCDLCLDAFVAMHLMGCGAWWYEATKP